ncbi:gluconolaconase [Actinoplanes ianthinogenes]|uniref:Gluconolaconase n=1 Tax=Actinoplanes ianthinogenes TaxID=122358 RepID=A0ABM7LLE5_9ACTN|nr:gluconolaconase [Actinoplanes ianthinogenes]GGR09824.1 gluconolaconase [Actinoplanes ianthinogenes]
MRALMAGVLGLALTACSSTPDKPSAGTSEQPAAQPLEAGGLVATTVQLDGHEMKVPAGWSVSLFARVPKARLLAWTPDRRLLVSRPKFGDVLALTPARAGGATVQRTLLSGLNEPHGLAFAGNTLYVAESDQINTFQYANGKVSGRKVVVDGLPDAKSSELRGAYAHALKSVAIGADGAIYISVGSTGNVSVEDRDASPERATILKAPPGGGTPTTFARGVRNGTGLAVAPDGAVWTAVNNRDNIADPADGKVKVDYVNDHPVEPLAKLTQGRDLGWPFCNPDTDRAFDRDVQLNPDGTKLDCATLAPVEQAMGAHSAPLGLSFATAPGLPAPYGKGALVGIHGSWNRKPPRAPEVSFFAWKDGGLGPQQTLLTGFQDEQGNRWGRPVMAVQGPDQAIYVSDDLAGAIYRVSWPGI